MVLLMRLWQRRWLRAGDGVTARVEVGTGALHPACSHCHQRVLQGDAGTQVLQPPAEQQAVGTRGNKGQRTARLGEVANWEAEGS